VLGAGCCCRLSCLECWSSGGLADVSGGWLGWLTRQEACSFHRTGAAASAAGSLAALIGCLPLLVEA
jgi:hypothetical protein